MSNNLGLNFTPILLAGDIITTGLKVKNATITVDNDDYSTINLSNFVGNTASFDNINILGNGIIDGNLEVGGNLSVGVAIDAPVIVVPLATFQIVNSQSADLREITSNNITNGNLLISNRIHSNTANLTIINSTTINSSQINSGIIYSNGCDISGNLIIRNPLNGNDNFQFQPQNDAFKISGSNILMDGVSSTYQATFENFSQININDPLFLNDTTTAGEHVNANSITLNNFTPSTKNNKLYNINGELYFNNSKLQQANLSGNYVPIIQQVSNDISKYQTALSYQLDFSSIGSNGTYFYYNSNPYPSVSDLPSFLFLYNAQNASTHLQLYDSTSQRRVGYLDGFKTTIQNDSSHKVAIYFSQKTNPTQNIYDGSSIVNHVDIDPDETIVFIYQQTFNYYYIVSRTVNLEAYNMKFNNMESVGTFSGATITATTLGANLAILGNVLMNNLLTGTITNTPNSIRLQGNMTIDPGYMITYSNTTIVQGNQLTDKNYVDAREAVFRSNLLASQNTWTNQNDFTGGSVRMRNTNLTVDDGTTSNYIQFQPTLAYTNNSGGSGYTFNGQSNTGDLIFTGYNNVRSSVPIKVNELKPVGTTLTIGGDNGLNTLNLATSDSTQVVNIGTGIGQTTINIGQAGDIININANVNYTEVNDLAIKDKDIILNSNSSGSGTARGAGLLIRDNNSNIAGKFVVNSLGTGYNLKAPEEAREINIDLPNFNNGLVKCSGNTLTSSAGAISDISGLQSALDGKLSLTGGTMSGTLTSYKEGEAIQIGTTTTNQQLITFGDGSRYFQIGKDADGSSTVGVGTTRAGMSANISANDKLRLIGTNGIEIPQLTASKPLSLDGSKNITSGDLSQSVITNLTSDLSGKASLSGATFTGSVISAIDNASFVCRRQTDTNSQFITFQDNSGAVSRGAIESAGSAGASAFGTVGAYDFNIGSFNNGGDTNIFYQGTVGGRKMRISSNITAFADINMNGSQKITNLATPTNANDATTKSYVDAQIAGNTSAILSSNNTFTGNNTFNGSTLTCGTLTNFQVNNITSTATNINVGFNSNTTFVSKKVMFNDATNTSSVIVWGGYTSPADANPTSHTNQNGLTISQTSTSCNAQVWNSRPLVVNGLGNNVEIGSQSGGTSNLKIWDELNILNKSNSSQYIRQFINTSDSNRGQIGTVGTNMTIRGQSGYNLKVDTYDYMEVNTAQRNTIGGNYQLIARSSGDGVAYQTFTNYAQNSVYLYWGVESSSGTGLFGLGNNAVVYGSTTTNLLGFYSNNKKTLVMDDGRLFDNVNSPISGKDPYSNTPGQARWRDGVFTGTFDNSKTITNMAYGDDSPITTGVRYTHTVIPDQNWIFSISGTYTGLTPGWYCFKVEWDDEIYMTANEVPFQATSYGSKNLPIYIKFGTLQFNMMIINQSGAGSMAYRLDLLTALNY